MKLLITLSLICLFCLTGCDSSKIPLGKYEGTNGRQKLGYEFTKTAIIITDVHVDGKIKEVSATYKYEGENAFVANNSIVFRFVINGSDLTLTNPLGTSNLKRVSKYSWE